MRVLLLDQFAELGGAQRGLLEAAEGFAAHGWRLYAAVPTGPLAERLSRLGATVTTIPCGPYRSVRKSWIDGVRFVSQLPAQRAVIRNIVECADIDVLYVNGPRVLPAAVLGSRGRSVVFHAHSIVTQNAAAHLTRLAIRRGTVTVLASSHFAANWLRSAAPQDRLHVIYNGIRADIRTPPHRLRHTRIGVLGRIAPEKGQLLFVEAARMASTKNPALKFLVGGAPVFGSSAYTDAVRQAAGPDVTFTGWVDNPTSFFEQIDVLVVPSSAVDANPRVIPEAYAAGVPVIAFDSGGVAELLTDGETGILVREQTSAALASAILSAVQQPEHLNAIAIQAQRRWAERYTLPRFQSEVCDALERAVRDPVSVRAAATA